MAPGSRHLIHRLFRYYKRRNQSVLIRGMGLWRLVGVMCTSGCSTLTMYMKLPTLPSPGGAKRRHVVFKFSGWVASSFEAGKSLTDCMHALHVRAIHYCVSCRTERKMKESCVIRSVHTSVGMLLLPHLWWEQELCFSLTRRWQVVCGLDTARTTIRPQLRNCAHREVEQECITI